MLRALENTGPHGQRLRALLQNFRAQERAMTALLHEMQAELEHGTREANWQRGSSPLAARTLLERCTELQIECDLLATELVHVRMAVAGASDELADHEDRLTRGNAAPERHASSA